MKRILLLTLLLLASAWKLSAQQTIYVIDNETVEQFDGSQLKGRTIKDYKITTTGSGSKAITVHAITTSPSAFSVSADSLLANPNRGAVRYTDRKIVYVLDGKKYEAADIPHVHPLDIENITILKDGSPEQLKYDPDANVIMITTKKNKQNQTGTIKKNPGAKVPN